MAEERSAKRLRSLDAGKRPESARRGEDVDYDDEETTMEAALEMQQLEMLNPEQRERYEFYRRSRIHPEAIKQVIVDFFEDTEGGNAEGLKVDMNQEMVIMLQGLAKLYTGSLVETARSIMLARGEQGGGSLQPRHYAEAFAQLRAARSVDQESAGQLGTAGRGRSAAGAGGSRRLLHGAPHAGPPDGSIV
jgi:hypothetical protein